jgi:hypothetical protein
LRTADSSELRAAAFVIALSRNLLDRIFTSHPVYASRRFQVALLREGFRSAVDVSGD